MNVPAKKTRKTETPEVVATKIAQKLTQKLDDCLRAEDSDTKTYKEKSDDPKRSLVTLATNNLTHKNRRIATIATALLHALTYEFDLNDGRNKLRVKAYKTTQNLALRVEEWRKELEPIVEYNLHRNRDYGANVEHFPAHAIPKRVAAISAELAELAEIVKKQLINYHSVFTPKLRGRPLDHLQLEVTRILYEGEVQVGEIAELTDSGDASAIRRVRKRLRRLMLVPAVRVVSGHQTVELPK